jgi:tRNA(adenine34) deaminase
VCVLYILCFLKISAKVRNKQGEYKRQPNKKERLKSGFLLTFTGETEHMAHHGTDESFMKAALAEAEKALGRDEVPVGAVIVCKGMIIARAHNLTETLNDPTAHAEMQAITAATAYLGGKYLKDCTIYVTVEPCPMCASALGWSQVSALVYGCADEKKGFTLIPAKLLQPSTKVTAGILEKECSKLMKGFFRSKRTSGKQ